MSVVIITHKVADYGVWKPYYDDDSQNRENFGFKELICGQKSDDPNTIYAIFETENPEVVNQMFADPEMERKMQEAGVTSKTGRNRKAKRVGKL